jgi:hypothetical protein
MKATLYLLFIVAGLRAYGADSPSPTGNENYFEALANPAATHDSETKRVAAQLAKSRVPTSKQAAEVALQTFVKKPGLDAREMWGVSGLYRLGLDVPDFGAAGDLIWEVRISRDFAGVSGVIWVSSSTGATRLLFP